MSVVSIEGRILSDEYPPYIIAEISANHNGSIECAKEMIQAAKAAGVNAVKIQTYTPDTMTIPSKNPDFMIDSGLWKGFSLYDLYTKAYTPFEWHEALFEYAKSIGITLFSSAFDETAVDLLASFDVPAYKVASFELVDLPLIAYIARQGKPMLMSTGMASLSEIEAAVATAKSHGCDQIALFHCISSYPAPLNEANLKAMLTLRETFNVQVGLSDHTLGSTASIVATSLGATVIEKHFTLSRAAGGVDSAFSIEPSEMAELVQACQAAWSALGSGGFERSEAEIENKAFRRSLYFVKDLAAGEVITTQHVRRIRPGFGLAPKYLEVVIGRAVKQAVRCGDRVAWHVLEEI